MTLTDEAASYAMDAQTLQSLRNMGNECEAAADEIQRLRADRDTEEACARLHAGLLREVALALGNEPGDDRSTLPERVRAMRDDVGRLRVALHEADTLLGNDDAETERREKWDGLWKVELTWRRSAPNYERQTMQLIAKKPTAAFVTMTREIVDALLALNTKNR